VNVSASKLGGENGQSLESLGLEQNVQARVRLELAVARLVPGIEGSAMERAVYEGEGGGGDEIAATPTDVVTCFANVVKYGMHAPLCPLAAMQFHSRRLHGHKDLIQQ
jgi:hypothetical protein